VEERMQAIAHQVLSRESLQTLIRRYDLYSDLRRQLTLEEMADKMFLDISLAPIQSKVGSQGGGKSNTVLAYTLSYMGKEPRRVAQIVNELTSMFLESNIKAREQNARKTLQFLQKQQEELNNELQQRDQAIAAFKRKHINELPENAQFNAQALEEMGRSQQELESTLRLLKSQKISLERQMASLDPLASLKREYNAQKATKSSSHPDVVRLKNRIDALEKGKGGAGQTATTKIEQKERELAALLEQYTDKHPDVLALKREIEDLKKREREFRTDAPEPTQNFEVIKIQGELEATEAGIRSASEELGRLKFKTNEQQRRLSNSPLVEQEYQNLFRDYQNAQTRYKETVARLLAAKEGVELEESRMGEKMTLISAATVPHSPDSPNRLKLMALAIILSLGAGLGLAALLETMDTSVHRSKDLTAITGFPVLATLPYLETVAEREREKRVRRIVLWSSGAAALVVLLILHFLILPLDILVIQIAKRVLMKG
jgi:polysaccharide biosynthesis transport protein